MRNVFIGAGIAAFLTLVPAASAQVGLPTINETTGISRHTEVIQNGQSIVNNSVDSLTSYSVGNGSASLANDTLATESGATLLNSTTRSLTTYGADAQAEAAATAGAKVTPNATVNGKRNEDGSVTVNYLISYEGDFDYGYDVAAGAKAAAANDSSSTVNGRSASVNLVGQAERHLERSGSDEVGPQSGSVSDETTIDP